jgi:small subunit ribosomal protein S4
MPIGPKEKKERSLGVRLQLKGERCQSPKCAMVRKPYAPGVHGKTRKYGAMLSDFGRQLQEKQKCKLSYGIDERALRQIFKRAFKRKGSTAANLVELLESRLDNVVFRLGFAPSRAAARQLVVHGHIMVNNAKVRAPGYMVKAGDVISVRPESAAFSAFKNIKESLKKYQAPEWLQLDAEELKGKVLAPPRETEVPFEVNALVEAFSR